MVFFRFRYNGPEIKASGLLEIDPETLNPGIPLYFELLETPPEEEEVKSGYLKAFSSVSLTPFEGSIKLRVNHISWNSKVVLLIRRIEVDDVRLHALLQHLCTLEDFKDRLEKLKDLPDDWTGSTSDWLKHPIGFIRSISRRLEQVVQIQKEARPFSPEVPFSKSGLALFILCTCIETMGRSKEYLFYNDWLTSRRTRQEVTDLIIKHEDEDNLSFLRSIYRDYLDIYGFRRAFYGFFNNQLNEEWQSILASCVSILVNKPPNFEPERIGEPLDDLVRYLEDFRNNFAHHLELNYQIPLEKEVPDGWLSSYPEANFMTYQKIFNDGSFETVFTRNLLNSLHLAIRYALWNWIQAESDER